jgi:hypothetical protein
MSPTKEVLAWDFDDVAFPFLHTFFLKFHNERYGSSFVYEDILTYELEHVLGCDWHEKQRRVEEFYASKHHDDMLPIEGAINAAKALSLYYRHVIITARPRKFEVQTRRLLSRHCPGLFEEEIHFLDHYVFKDAPRLSKGKKCIEIGAIACIEDGAHNVANLVEEGVPVYLPDMPWNQHVSHPLVKRIHHWEEVVCDLLPTAA